MTENDKIALLNDINTTAKMLDYCRKKRKETGEKLLQLENKETGEKLLQLENREKIANTIELQLNIFTVINTLHDLMHAYINAAASEGYEIIWEGCKAVDIVEKEGKENEK